MDIVHARCAGMDISKTDAKVCVRIAGRGRGRASSTVTTWAATSSSILRLADVLVKQKLTCVVMEATGDYWKPFYYLLAEAGLPVMLVNARQVRQIPGRKTDLLTELPDRILGLSPGASRGVARLPGHGRRRGCTAGVVTVGGAAAGVA
jgi:hypothetical protein